MQKDKHVINKIKIIETKIMQTNRKTTDEQHKPIKNYR